MNNDRANWHAISDRVLTLARIICEAICTKLSMPGAQRSVLIVGPLYAKALQSFMSAVELEKRGLVEDGIGCLRSCAESAMAMIAVVDDESFVFRLIGDHHFQRQGYGQKVMSNSAIRESLTADEKARIAAAINEHRSENAKRLNWEEVSSICKTTKAKEAVSALYLIHHRASSARLHVGLDSLKSFVEVNEGRKTIELKWKPLEMGSIEVLKSGCDVMFYAMITCVHFFDLVDLQEMVRSLHAQYREQLS